METEKKGQHKHPVLRSCIKWSLYASISIWLGVTVFDQIEKHINVSFWGHIGAEKERQLSCIKDMYYMFVTKKITDYSAHEWQRDELYTFRSQEGALYKKGTIFVKYLRGLPGDTLEINDKHEIMVNGKVVASGFPIFERHGIRVPEKFIFKETIPPHKYYMLGDTEHSYDSRYWGYVDEEDIIGRAYGFFAVGK